MANTFTTFKTKLSEEFEQEDYYQFWGWILPADYDSSNISPTSLMGKGGTRKKGGILYVPTSQQRTSYNNYTHATLAKVAGLDAKKAGRLGWVRFHLESGELELGANAPINTKTIANGISVIDSICNKEVDAKIAEKLQQAFGHEKYEMEYDTILINLDLKDTYGNNHFFAVKGNTGRDIVSNIQQFFEKHPEYKSQLKEDNTRRVYGVNLLSELIQSDKKLSLSLNNILNENASELQLEESLNSLLDVATLIIEADEPDIPVEPEVSKENNPEGEIEIDTEEQKDEEDFEEKIKAEIETEKDESKKQLLVNLQDLVPILKRFSKGSYKNIVKLLYNFLKAGDDETNISTEDKSVMADISFDLMNTIIRNKDLISIINTEAKVMINSSINEGTIEEAKKKKTVSKKKKKTVGITPKLEVLLRLGLVPKELFTRAKKALNSKKETGSIPMYRNLLFDILEEIVDYIENDPTLYNRIRINVMKETQKSYPTKKTIMDAYEAGKKCKSCGEPMPEEYEKEYILKSAWDRGFNADPPPEQPKSEVENI